MKKLVAGVGLNDADYQVKPRKGTHCPYHKVWTNMINRVYAESYRSRFPAYVGCYVCDDWLTFSKFKAWMEKQDWEGKHLDKDLLVPGNKVYSPETCVFVSRHVNNFISSNAFKDHGLPMGVYLNRSGTYVAQASGYLGSFHTADEAHNAYAIQRIKLAEQLASVQTDKRISDALLSQFAK